MNILVTGAGGFIGSNLVNELTKYHNVLALDNEINGSFDRLNKSNRLICLKESVVEVDEYLEDVDYIFYLACTQISVSDSDPYTDLSTNTIGLLSILEYFRDNPSNSLKRIIYTSSCSIYGNSKDFPTTEETPNDISSIYASTKFLAENYCNLYHKNYGVPISIVRYSNVYGYNQSIKYTCGVIGKFIDQSLNKEPLTIIGDGGNTRDYTFIDDAVSATIEIAFNDVTLGETYNVSSGFSYSVNDIVEIIACHQSIDVEYIDKRIIDNIKDRVISHDKLTKAIGWMPKTSIEDGIYKTIAYKLTNE